MAVADGFFLAQPPSAFSATDRNAARDEAAYLSIQTSYNSCSVLVENGNFRRFLLLQGSSLAALHLWRGSNPADPDACWARLKEP